MKRSYETPKVMRIDFCYDEQVVAGSGNVATYGDPNHIGRCQQSSANSCVHFWSGSGCVAEPFSLRKKK